MQVGGQCDLDAVTFMLSSDKRICLARRGAYPNRVIEVFSQAHQGSDQAARSTLEGQSRPGATESCRPTMRQQNDGSHMSIVPDADLRHADERGASGVATVVVTEHQQRQPEAVRQCRGA